MTITARALVAEGKLDEASGMLRDALGVEQRVYKGVHPRIATTYNELGKIAQKQGKFEDAAADFQKAAKIYQKAYDGKHYYIGVALSNLGSVYADENRYPQAEHFLRQAIQMYSATLPGDHQLIAVARIKLGHVLLMEQRYSDAEAETRSGYETLGSQPNPSADWLQNARRDLLAEYEALKEPDKAATFRSDVSPGNGKTAEEARKD